jgi:hypothetical protein
MTVQILPRQQRIPIPTEQDYASGVGGQLLPSPLVEMKTLQVTIEAAKEQVEEMRAARPISTEVADRIIGWTADDSLDWDTLIASDSGWGIAEP